MQCNCGGGSRPCEAKQTIGRGDNALRVVLSYSSCSACGRIGSEMLHLNGQLELTGPIAVRRYQSYFGDVEAESPKLQPAPEARQDDAKAPSQQFTKIESPSHINLNPRKLLLIFKSKSDPRPTASVLCIDRLFADGRHLIVEELGIESVSNNGDCLGAFFDGTQQTLEHFSRMWNLPVDSMKLAVTSAPPASEHAIQPSISIKSPLYEVADEGIAESLPASQSEEIPSVLFSSTSAIDNTTKQLSLF